MAEFLAQRWRQQPKYPAQLDRSHPIAGTISHLWNGAQHDGLEQLQRRVPVRTEGSPTRRAMSGGLFGLNFDGNDGYHYAREAASRTYSGLVVFKRDGTSVDSQLMADDPSSVGTRCFQWRFDAVSDTMRFVRFDSGGVQQLTLSVVGSTSKVMVAAFANVSQVGTRIYCDRLSAAATYAGTTNLSSSNAVAIACRNINGSSGASSDFFNGSLAMWAFADGAAWPDAVCRDLCANPWQLLRRPRHRIYSLPPAGGSFNASWARNSNVILPPGVL